MRTPMRILRLLTLVWGVGSEFVAALEDRELTPQEAKRITKRLFTLIEETAPDLDPESKNHLADALVALAAEIRG